LLEQCVASPVFPDCIMTFAFQNVILAISGTKTFSCV
jgi:hypothetical protein